jgi:hypothetical protein
MKAALVCLIGCCVTLTLEAAAAESLARSGSQPGVTDMAAATEGTATHAQARIDGRSNPREPSAAASGTGAAERVPSGGRHAASEVAPRPTPFGPRGSGAPARSNTDRLHALLDKTARGRTAKPSGRRVAAGTSPSGGAAAPTRGSSTLPKGVAQLQVAKTVNVLRTLPKAGARATMLGGPASGLGAHGSTINGTRAHRKF